MPNNKIMEFRQNITLASALCVLLLSSTAEARWLHVFFRDSRTLALPPKANAFSQAKTPLPSPSKSQSRSPSSSPFRSPSPSGSPSSSPSPLPLRSPSTPAPTLAPTQAPSAFKPVTRPVPNSELKKLCDTTEDPAFCAKKISPYVTGDKGSIPVLKAAIQAAAKQATAAIDEAQKKAQEPSLPKDTAENLKKCVNKYDHVVEELQQSFSAVGGKDMRTITGLLRDSLDYVINCDESFNVGSGKPENLGKANEAREDLERLLNISIKIKEEIPSS